MTERDKVYLGALLHDIGKFIERAKLPEWQERAERYVKSGDADVTFAHKRYSAALIDEFKSRKPFLSDAISAFALWHHRGSDPNKKDYESINSKGVLLKLIRIADDCASAERKDDAHLEPQKYYLARLQSPFADIEIDGKRLAKPLYLDLHPLSQNAESMFQSSNQPAFEEKEKSPYQRIVKEFLQALEKIETEDELLYLLEKFCHSTPAQTPVAFQGKERLSKPDINLYDHLRSTAAIALCLYDEYVEGSWKGKDADILNDGKEGYKRDSFPEPCLLVAGDVSGIQDFIFSVTTKGAAKALKG
ncbi:MAG: HD domain-containing protein [Chloroherpetonaceae bacterium]|nr:HD domain-containing protein [Chloroherpetonaceae bacterium]